MIRDKRRRRHLSLRHRTVGTTERPRLCVHRSNANIAAQLVDDSSSTVLTGASSLSPELRQKEMNKTDMAREVGKLIAEKARALGKTKVVFDRAGYRYHGRVRALAEGAREGGLEF